MTSSVLHTRLWQERGSIHPGILILDDVAVDAQYWSIRQFLELNEPNDVLNQVVAVPPHRSTSTRAAMRRASVRLETAYRMSFTQRNPMWFVPLSGVVLLRAATR